MTVSAVLSPVAVQVVTMVEPLPVACHLHGPWAASQLSVFAFSWPAVSDPNCPSFHKKLHLFWLKLVQSASRHAISYRRRA